MEPDDEPTETETHRFTLNRELGPESSRVGLDGGGDGQSIPSNRVPTEFWKSFTYFSFSTKLNRGGVLDYVELDSR